MAHHNKGKLKLNNVEDPATNMKPECSVCRMVVADCIDFSVQIKKAVHH
jgi:hypothetical protein